MYGYILYWYILAHYILSTYILYPYNITDGIRKKLVKIGGKVVLTSASDRFTISSNNRIKAERKGKQVRKI
jgi:hypothetical protein